MTARRAVTLFALLFACPLFAETPWSITPVSGPASGGTEVTIQGDFHEDRPYVVLFGEIPARSTTRVDAHTLVAVTPAHLPGASTIRIFDYSFTPLKFTFTGAAPVEEFARLLVPININRVTGAFGSQFETELFAIAKRGEPGVYGLIGACWIECIKGDPWDFPERLMTDEATYGLPDVTPERFLYVRRDEVEDVAMSLRAYDVSRDRDNYGTAIPIVNFDEASDTVIAIPGIPSHPRFRNSLRIYSDAPMKVTVRAAHVEEVVQLEAGANAFEPAFATWANFPASGGPISVTVTAEAAGSPQVYLGKVWALVTVTNNDTQHIMALWPQP